jgi:hypothetical protein
LENLGIDGSEKLKWTLNKIGKMVQTGTLVNMVMNLQVP